jgi:hypothetical protein
MILFFYGCYTILRLVCTAGRRDLSAEVRIDAIETYQRAQVQDSFGGCGVSNWGHLVGQIWLSVGSIWLLTAIRTQTKPVEG